MKNVIIYSPSSHTLLLLILISKVEGKIFNEQQHKFGSVLTQIYHTTSVDLEYNSQALF